VVREVEKLVNVEVIKEVPVEVIKEVVREVPVEVVKEVVREVPVEVVREVEIIKEVPVEVIKEVVREVPVEAGREAIAGEDRRRRKEAPAAPPRGPRPVPAKAGVEVLVVDDDEAIRTNVGEVLEGAGYTVVLASSGLEAIAKVRERGTPFDLVLTDLGMPDVPGWEVVEAVRQIETSTPVVIISGFDRQRAARRARELKVDLIISKPFELAELVNSVRALLTRPRG
jgi:CheY-like chemotaxis protein